MCLFPPATMADCLPSYKNDRVIAACDIQGDSKRRKLSATKRKRDRSFSEWKDMKLRRPIKKFKTCITCRNQTFPSQLGSVWMLPSNRLWMPCNTVCCQKMSKVALHERYTWYNLSSIDSYIGYMHLWTYQVHLLRPWSWKLWSIFRAFEMPTFGMLLVHNSANDTRPFHRSVFEFSLKLCSCHGNVIGHMSFKDPVD